MLDMCFQNYKFVILDGGFLCHSYEKPNLEWTYDEMQLVIRVLEKGYLGYASMIWFASYKNGKHNDKDWYGCNRHNKMVNKINE